MTGSAEDVRQKARQLWDRYYALTEELLKFIDKRDVDTFLSIVSQRGGIIEKMKSLPENDFRQTEECQALIAKIKPLDMQIAYKARTWLNKSRRQNAAVKSYNLRPMQPAGNIFNRSY